MTVDETVANFIEKFILKIEIWDTNRETSEETFLESRDLDISELLFMGEKDSTLTWTFDKL